MSYFLLQPVVQLRYKQLLIYNKLEVSKEYTNKNKQTIIERLKNTKRYSGLMTIGAKKRLAKSIDTLLQISPEQKIINPINNRFQKFQLTFLTLTISDNTKIYDVKFCNEKLLAPFLRWLNLKYKVESYIWKCELQERGQPHYHIISNCFLRYDYVKNYWNNLQYNLGMLEGYKNKFGNTNPNSTDIHAIYKVQDVKKYLLKYMQKSIQNKLSVNGKIWDCSKNLKSAKNFEFYYEDIRATNFKPFLDNENTTSFSNDHCMILGNNHIKTTSILSSPQRLQFKQHLKEIKHYYEPEYIAIRKEINEAKENLVKAQKNESPNLNNSSFYVSVLDNGPKLIDKQITIDLPF
jgi:hypothetical protein